MSEQGWREFLAAEGGGDWVVLHGGATAVFRVGTLSAAARLAEAIAQIPGLEGAGVLMTVGDGFLSVRLTRDLWQLESHTPTLRGPSRTSRASTTRAQIVGPFKRCRWRSRLSRMT